MTEKPREATEKFRVAIIANNEQAAKFIKSQLRFREATVEVIVFPTARKLLSYDKFHLIIESERFWQHTDAQAISENANVKLV